ncbi:endolysin [Arthrobacter phage GlobiWarming]|nr:endolysin [Arthrobacter phage GlobiWarming]
MKQLITPNPNIPCQPGWCLQYVRQAFGLEARYASATEAWEKSTTQHRDRNFPPGKWTPVWYGLDTTPLGHVVILAPDMSVYSTSDLVNVPHHHPDLADLEAYYAYYGMNLTYRGWTEDVAGFPVMQPTLEAQSTTITKAGFLMALTDEQQQLVYDRLKNYVDAPISAVPEKVMESRVTHGGTHSFRTELVKTRQQVIALSSLVAQLAKNPNLTADQITDAVKAGLEEAVVDVDINVTGREVV